VLFFVAPGPNFDFASFNFQVPIAGFGQAHIHATNKQYRQRNRITIVSYLLFIELQNDKTFFWCGGFITRWSIWQLDSQTELRFRDFEAVTRASVLCAKRMPYSAVS